MRISFVFLLSLLLGAAGFAQSNPVGSNFKADSTALAQKTKLALMEAEKLQALGKLDREYRIAAAQAGVDTTRNQAKAPMTTATGSKYICESPKQPWFQIHKPAFKPEGGFRFGWSEIGTFASIGAGTRAYVKVGNPGTKFYNAGTFSVLGTINCTEFTQTPSLRDWGKSSHVLFSSKAGLEYAWSSKETPYKFLLGAYFEKFLYPGSVTWMRTFTDRSDPQQPVTTTTKTTLRFPDQHMSLQFRVVPFNRFWVGLGGVYYPRFEPSYNGFTHKYGVQASIGFGL